LGYIKNNPEVLFTLDEIKEGNIFKKIMGFIKIIPHLFWIRAGNIIHK